METGETIEVGADGGDLRYWKAKEAVRQGEARLGAQASVRTALEARATAVTGWAAAGLLAVAGAGFAAQEGRARAAAAVAASVLLAAAVTGVHAARPRNWSMVGYDPTVILNDQLPSELEILESLALGMNPGIQDNSDQIEQIGKMIRWAGRLLILAPVSGALTYLFAGRLTWSMSAAVRQLCP